MKSGKQPRRRPGWLQKARDHWEYAGERRPPFAVDPKKGQRSVWDFPRPPVIEKVPRHITVVHQGKPIADSRNALAVLETASPPTYYLPERDIQWDMLAEMPGKTSLCEWKGRATYWSLNNMPGQPVAWSYPDPFEEFATLKNHLAFYPQNLDCNVDGIPVRPQPGNFYAGWITPDLVGPFKGEPGTGHW